MFERKEFIEKFSLSDCFRFFIKKGKGLKAINLFKQLFLDLAKNKIKVNDNLPIFFTQLNQQFFDLAPKIGFIYRFIKKRNKKVPVGLTELQQKNMLLRTFSRLVRNVRQKSCKTLLTEIVLINNNDEASKLFQAQLFIHKKAVELKGLIRPFRPKFWIKKENFSSKSYLDRKIEQHFLAKKISKVSFLFKKKLENLKFAIFNHSSKRKIFKKLLFSYILNDST